MSREPLAITPRALALLARPPLHVIRVLPLVLAGLGAWILEALLGSPDTGGAVLAIINVWVQIAIMIISAILSYALAPKPMEPPKPSLEDFDFPTAEEGRPIPVVFGTVWISGPNILWYGDLDTQAVKSKGGKK